MSANRNKAHQTAAKSAVALRAQPHGGALLPGGQPGNRGGSGRPPSAVRLRCLDSFEARITVAEEIADNSGERPRDRLAALDLLARYAGLGAHSFDPEAALRSEVRNREIDAITGW